MHEVKKEKRCLGMVSVLFIWALPSKIYAFDAKYNPIGTVTINTVKNSNVLRADTMDPSLLNKTKKRIISTH